MYITGWIQGLYAKKKGIWIAFNNQEVKHAFGPE